MFPQGGPGLGLAALRLAVAAGLILHAAAMDGLGTAPLIDLLVALSAVALFLGALTPWLSLLCVLLVVAESWWRPFSLSSALSLALFGLSAAALLMLGPGAYSLDARLFGRRVLRMTRDE